MKDEEGPRLEFLIHEEDARRIDALQRRYPEKSRSEIEGELFQMGFQEMKRDPADFKRRLRELDPLSSGPLGLVPPPEDDKR